MGQSHKRSFMRAVLTGYGHMGSTILVQLLLVPLYLNQLGSEAFGVLMMFLSFFNFASMGIAWMSSGALRLFGEAYAAEDREQFAHSYGVSQVLYIAYASVIGLVVIAGVVFCSDAIFSLNDEALQAQLPTLSVLAAAYFVLMYDAAIVRMPLTAATQQATANIIQMAGTLVFAGLAVALLLMGYDMVAIFAALVFSQFITSVLGRIMLKRRNLFGPVKRGWNEETRNVLRRLLGKQGVGFLLYGMLFIALQGDIFLIGLIGGAEMAAAYTLIWKIAEVAATILSRLPESLSPYLITLDAKKDYGALKRMLPKAYVSLAFLGLVAGIIYAFLGPVMVELWVGAEHAPTEAMAYWLAGGMIFWLTLSKLPIALALATVRLRLLIITSFVELCAKWSIVLILYGSYGYMSLLMAGNATHALGVAFAYMLIIFGYYRETVNNLKNSEKNA